MLKHKENDKLINLDSRTNPPTENILNEKCSILQKVYSPMDNSNNIIYNKAVDYESLGFSQILKMLKDIKAKSQKLKTEKTISLFDSDTKSYENSFQNAVQSQQDYINEISILEVTTNNLIDSNYALIPNSLVFGIRDTIKTNNNMTDNNYELDVIHDESDNLNVTLLETLEEKGVNNSWESFKARSLNIDNSLIKLKSQLCRLAETQIDNNIQNNTNLSDIGTVEPESNSKSSNIKNQSLKKTKTLTNIPVGQMTLIPNLQFDIGKNCLKVKTKSPGKVITINTEGTENNHKEAIHSKINVSLLETLEGETLTTEKNYSGEVDNSINKIPNLSDFDTVESNQSHYIDTNCLKVKTKSPVKVIRANKDSIENNHKKLEAIHAGTDNVSLLETLEGKYLMKKNVITEEIDSAKVHKSGALKLDNILIKLRESKMRSLLSKLPENENSINVKIKDPKSNTKPLVSLNLSDSSCNFDINNSKSNVNQTPINYKSPNIHKKHTTTVTDVIKLPMKNALDDEEIKRILITEYEKYEKKKKMHNSLTQNDKMMRIEKLTQQYQFKGNKKCQMKRYRKGKIKIYRLRKLKKSSSTEVKEENINLENVLQQLTQNFIEPESKLTRLKSGSSISTSSSYITDETKSEILSTSSLDLTKSQLKLREGLNDLLRDKNLINEEKNPCLLEYDKSEIKMKIQDIFLQIFDDLTHGRRSVLKFRRHIFENCTLKEGRLQFKSDNISTTAVSSNSQNSQMKFKLILFVMKKIQILLETNSKLTKRELFYQMKDMIKNQAAMDRAINAVSCLLNVGMWGLNIIAQKGLVYGDLKILMSSEETLNCNIPGTLIPQDIEEIIELQSSAYFILVVEKESIFHKLIEEDLPKKLTRPFIMITGKGFPDLNTQLFLRKLWIIMSIPVFIMVDADPYGIQIMLNYRFGSVNNVHVSHHLAVPKAKWLGIYPSEIKDFDVISQPLTEREIKLVHNLLKTPYMVENPGITNELQVMLANKKKAGIEALIKSHIFLSEVYLPTKFYLHKFI